MNSLITGLIFSILISPSNLSDSCKDFYPNHPVRSDIMMQVVLKSYGYYEGQIDGLFGKKTRNSLIIFQLNNQLEPDGVIGSKTCTLLLNKSKIQKNTKTNTVVENKANSFSQEIYDAQLVLKELGLYTSVVDGINGNGTKNALKEFQSKSGLVVDGVLGSKTKAALSKGEDSYVISNSSSSNNSDTATTNNEVVNYGLDLINYDPSKPCIEGYVDSNGIWVPDPCFKPVFVYIDLVKQLK